MIRPIFTLSILAFAFYILLPASGSVFGLNAGPASAATDLMQCMESCIRHQQGNLQVALRQRAVRDRWRHVPQPRFRRLHVGLQRLSGRLRQGQKVQARL